MTRYRPALLTAAIAAPNRLPGADREGRNVCRMHDARAEAPAGGTNGVRKLIRTSCALVRQIGAS
jgi:hypothetical protein